MEKVAAECGDGEKLLTKADVTSESDMKNVLDQTIKKFGKLDVLVNVRDVKLYVVKVLIRLTLM